MRNKDKVTWSSGNVFTDLGLPDAEELPVKAQLNLNLRRLMTLHGLTQREVAARVGTDQPTISKVLRGHLDMVTVQDLSVWLMRVNA
jgi:predicted XRE-type DNA-binding protein